MHDNNGDRQHRHPGESAGARGGSAASGKVTRTSRLAASSHAGPPAVQRMQAGGGPPATARSGAEWTADPWLDTALRGTPPAEAVQRSASRDRGPAALSVDDAESGGEGGDQAHQAGDAAALAAGIDNFDGPVEVADDESDTDESGTSGQQAVDVTDQEPAGDTATPTVTIGAVQSPTSPAGMPSRIPPRVDTDVVVTVSGYTQGMADIVLSIDGAGGTNGAATIDGAATKVQNAGATVKLRGTTQTAPGNAGNLRLVAKQGTAALAQSNAFSVSSIPQNFSVSFDALINSGTRWGIRVNNSWESDSGNVADLDQAQRSESVSYPSKTGVFSAVSLSAHNSGYNSGHNPPRQDSHTLGPVATLKALKGNGSIVANQVFILWDKRTGAKDIPVRRSGFQITKSLAYDASAGSTTLTVAKQGASVTANGYSSAAGAGNVSRDLPL